MKQTIIIAAIVLLGFGLIFSWRSESQTHTFPALDTNNIFTGTNKFKNLNNVRFADQFAGATADVQINAAIADLPAAGGIVDARGYGSSTVSIASPIVVGTSSKPVVLIYDTTTNFQVSVTGGVCAIQIGNGSAVSNLYGAGSPQATGSGQGQWQLTSTANVSSLVCNGAQDGTQEYFTWRGGYLTAAVGATVSNALMDINRVGINSVVEDAVFTTSPGTSIGLRVRNVQGIRLNNLWSIQNGNGVSIEDSFNVIVTQLMSEQCQATSCYHLQIQRVNETLSAQGTVAVYGYHCEYSPGAGDTKNCLLLDGADETIIDGFTTSNLSGANPITNAVKIVNTSGATLRNSYTIRHFKHLANGLTNLINDTVSGRALTTVTYGSKYREISSSGESTDLKINMGDPAAANVSTCIWQMLGTSVPFCIAEDSGALIHMGFFSNPDMLTLVSGNSVKFGVAPVPNAAAGVDLGATALPFGNLWLGTAATNNFKFQPAPTAAARTVVIPDFGTSGLSTQNFPSTVVLHSAYTNATTTFSTLGDGTRTVSFPVSASVDYTLSCDIIYQSSATTAGPKIQVTGPASPTAVVLAAQGGTNATAFADAAVTAFSTALTAFGTAGATATNFVLRINAGIANGTNAGTVALQLAANGAGTLTVAAGSSCSIQ